MEWQPIETAPRSYYDNNGLVKELILILVNGHVYEAYFQPKSSILTEDGWSSNIHGGWFEENTPTHWMPMPDTPQQSA